MAVTVYNSTDALAPVLTGQAGSFLSLLNTVLVGTTGYGTKVGAGWSKGGYADSSNVGVVQTSSGTFYQIDDAATTWAKIRGYLGYSGAGSDQFPTVAQTTAGGFVYKSLTADATARAWIIVADSRTAHIFFNSGTAYGWTYIHIGDISSYKANDGFKGLIAAPSNNSSQNNCLLAYGTRTAYAGTTCFMPRAYTQLGTSIKTSLFFDGAKLGISTLVAVGSSTLTATYPNPVDGGLYMSRLYVMEDVNVITRGQLRGIWCPLHNMPLATGDTFAGTGAMAGKTFLALKVYINSTAPQSGMIMIETSDTWEA